MKIEVGKKYCCGRIVVTVVKVTPWDNSVYFESNCSWFVKDESGYAALSLDYFEEMYEEYKPTPFETIYAPVESKTDILGIYEICLN